MVSSGASWWGVGLTLLALLGTCVSPTPTGLGKEHRNWEFREWLETPMPNNAPVAYEVMAECTGIPPRVRLERIRWFIVREIVHRETGHPAVGVAVTPGDRIYLRWDHWDDPYVLEHEILHLLLPWDGHCGSAFLACDPIIHWRPADECENVN